MSTVSGGSFSMSLLVNAEILIIGKGFETLKNDLECDNVKVIGTVEDVSEYFYRADFVIAPIFEGSGMKLKTAEALMYGKTIFGTTEAFPDTRWISIGWEGCAIRLGNSSIRSTVIRIRRGGSTRKAENLRTKLQHGTFEAFYSE